MEKFRFWLSALRLGNLIIHLACKNQSPSDRMGSSAGFAIARQRKRIKQQCRECGVAGLSGMRGDQIPARRGEESYSGSQG
jgi:hypothetical protein